MHLSLSPHPDLRIESTVSALRVLVLEESREEARDIHQVLSQAGLALAVFCRVEGREALASQLAHERWDLVLSPLRPAAMELAELIALLRDRDSDLPLILVYGPSQEAEALAWMRKGARDCVARDRLARLPLAVEREVKEAQGRRERRTMQEQLLLAERMASMGTLAAGIAHELNNPLASVMANVELSIRALQRQPSAPSELLEQLNDAREASDRIRHIIRDLKIFSRADEERRGPVDVRRVLESSLRMARNEIRHRAQLLCDYAALPPVVANEARLGQVFLNLIVNAAQAIGEGRAETNRIRVATRLVEGRVCVEVSDTGSGIPAAILPRIFDPFFTTKAIGEGTGLGLAICHRIIARLGGNIEVQSTVGEGSSFRVYLPVYERARNEEPEKAALSSSKALRRARILVVDDEATVARAVERTLSPEHEVVTIPTVAEALERLAAGEHFDLILSDVMMPQLTGADFYTMLRRVAPQHASAMIFLTGGAFTSKAREFLENLPNLRIDKPFDPNELRDVVNQRLR